MPERVLLIRDGITETLIRSANAMADNIRIYGLVPDSIVDGPGLRYSIFVQGCTHHCPGCHNPESQPVDGGTLMEIRSILDDIHGNKLIQGVTFSGGEPMEQAEACADLAEVLKAKGYDIWAYTGYLFEDLMRSNVYDDRRRFLDHVDVLVDGPFIEARKTYDLEWRGSANQRLIDVPKSLASGAVVAWKKPGISFEKPDNW